MPPRRRARTPARSGFEDGAVTVIADLPKRVDWDQAKLAQTRRTHRVGWRRPRRVRRHRVQVPERKYTAWPGNPAKEFEPARTVRTGKPKFRLVLGEEVR